MYKVPEHEPDYAFIPDVETPEKNRYGKAIDLLAGNDELKGKSLNINGDNSIGDNPNRYKQHGFYFNADNCIACHACEAACAEKNDTPPHLAFRSVGYLEGGSYPATQRLNISMACNHCDNPVCLKGCPTRAYTKFAEYGAVLQDPDICFGCGYCTWVCPYNAPQLDPVAGHVSKCNMCVDRLEVGLKPACASACLGGALDFGLVETTPENCEQLETQIPGFPDPSITQPNIRFQQQRSLPREMTRTDSTPIKYVRDDQNAKPDPEVKGGQSAYHSAPLSSEGKKMQWGLGKLSSRENPLVIFTLITQAVIGAFLVFFLAPVFGFDAFNATNYPLAFPVSLFVLIGLETFALVISTLHLGRPHRFYRAFNNLKYSPVSREVAAVAVFYNLLGAYAVLNGLPQLFAWLPGNVLGFLQQAAGWLTVMAGPVSLYFMHAIYRIEARPYWNHWQVLTSFYGSMLTLGAILAGVFMIPLLGSTNIDYSGLFDGLMWVMLAGLVIEGFGLYRHAHYLRHATGEGQAAHVEQTITFGKSYWSRNIVFAASAMMLLWMLLMSDSSVIGWSAVSVFVVVAAIIGRAMFYVMVIPTTMPGAFFWKNPLFQDHAREAGLAEMQQVGVQVETH